MSNLTAHGGTRMETQPISSTKDHDGQYHWRQDVSRGQISGGVGMTIPKMESASCIDKFDPSEFGYMPFNEQFEFDAEDLAQMIRVISFAWKKAIRPLNEKPPREAFCRVGAQ